MATNPFSAQGTTFTDQQLKDYWGNIGNNFKQLYDDAYSKNWTNNDLYNLGQYSQGLGIGTGASQDQIKSMAGQYGYGFDPSGRLTRNSVPATPATVPTTTTKAPATTTTGTATTPLATTTQTTTKPATDSQYTIGSGFGLLGSATPLATSLTASNGQTLSSDELKQYFQNINGGWNYLYRDAADKGWSVDDMAKLYDFAQARGYQGVGNLTSTLDPLSYKVGSNPTTQDRIRSTAMKYGYSVDANGKLVANTNPYAATDANTPLNTYMNQTFGDNSQFANGDHYDAARFSTGANGLDINAFADGNRVTTRDIYTALGGKVNADGTFADHNLYSLASTMGNKSNAGAIGDLDWDKIMRSADPRAEWSRQTNEAAAPQIMRGPDGTMYLVNTKTGLIMTSVGQNTANVNDKQWQDFQGRALSRFGFNLNDVLAKGIGNLDRSTYDKYIANASDPAVLRQMNPYYDQNVAANQQRIAEDRGNPNGPWAIKNAQGDFAALSQNPGYGRDQYISYAKSLLARGMSPQNVASIVGNKYDISAEVPQLAGLNLPGGNTSATGITGSGSSAYQGGLIGTTASAGATASTSGTGVSAVTGGVGGTPGSAGPQGTSGLQTIAPESVTNRVSGLINQDSPLMVNERTKAMQQMNARGLLNSSLAVTAGEEAVLNKAESLATADATLSQEANKFNVNWANDLYKTGVQFTQDLAKLKAQGDIDLQKLAASSANDMAKLRLQGDLEMQQIAAKYGNDAALQDSRLAWEQAKAEMDSQLQTTLQQMRNAGGIADANNTAKLDAIMKANVLMVDTQKYIADITANKDMDDASKSALIQKQLDSATMALNGYSMIYGQDLSNILNFGSLRPTGGLINTTANNSTTTPQITADSGAQIG